MLAIASSEQNKIKGRERVMKGENASKANKQANINPHKILLWSIVGAIIVVIGVSFLLFKLGVFSNNGVAGDSDHPRVAIEIEGHGTIVVELDRTQAPQTVDNFMKLVNEGFYNGLTFHRIINGFMIQGGDPTGTGSGGSEDTIEGEFAANGINNNISHERGVISMARPNDFNAARSQFFIVHQDATFLDGQYASFGHVVSGMDIVDALATGTAVTDQNGSVAPENQPVMTRVYQVIDNQ